jgi:outer membrane usher protein
VTYGDLKSAEASLAWRSPVMTIRGAAMQVNRASLAQLSVEGALVVADGSVFASNRITDAFAIVNAGAPGVRVRYENREVGKTRGDGRLLVTSLRSLQRNKISIDAETMPVDAIVESDKTYVVPGVRAGVVVNFNTRRLTRAALVILHDAEGKPLPPGSEVTLDGAEETFTVGYDGETFLDGLRETNHITVQTENGACEATFAFHPRKGEVQPVIGPVTCQ